MHIQSMNNYAQLTQCENALNNLMHAINNHLSISKINYDHMDTSTDTYHIYGYIYMGICLVIVAACCMCVVKSYYARTNIPVNMDTIKLIKLQLM